MDPVLWFWGSVAVLVVMLFFPVSRIVWVLSVRRMQRKLQRELVPQELEGQMRRARFIAIFVCLIFSVLFCLQMIGYPKNG